MNIKYEQSLLWLATNPNDDQQYHVATEQDLIDYATEIEQFWDNYQSSKPIEIKQLDNMYVDFLTRIWTNCLRTAGLIPSDYTITVENTSEAQNIGYLMTLRMMDRALYLEMSSEFINFRTVINAAGYGLDKCKLHQLS